MNKKLSSLVLAIALASSVVPTLAVSATPVRQAGQTATKKVEVAKKVVAKKVVAKKAVAKKAVAKKAVAKKVATKKVKAVAKKG